ncbi:hypothetical protein G6F59_017021 [Rhizopus arrhizus]|nr:hypothetical protein G6F59_017021 [Rhizopus arrhizus]
MGAPQQEGLGRWVAGDQRNQGVGHGFPAALGVGGGLAVFHRQCGWADACNRRAPKTPGPGPGPRRDTGLAPGSPRARPTARAHAGPGTAWRDRPPRLRQGAFRRGR